MRVSAWAHAGLNCGDVGSALSGGLCPRATPPHPARPRPLGKEAVCGAPANAHLLGLRVIEGGCGVQDSLLGIVEQL